MLAAWLHGIVHTLDMGDLDNARYWYQKVGCVFPGPNAAQEELAAARRVVQATMAGHEQYERRERFCLPWSLASPRSDPRGFRDGCRWDATLSASPHAGGSGRAFLSRGY